MDDDAPSRIRGCVGRDYADGSTVYRPKHGSPSPNLVEGSGVAMSFLFEYIFPIRMLVCLTHRSDRLAISSQKDFFFYFFSFFIERPVIGFD